MFPSSKLFEAVICLIALLVPPHLSDAATITVRQDGSGDYTTIAEAVAAADSNDTIDVGPGTYMEENWIDKSLAFVSQTGSDSTIIDGEGVRRGLVFNGTITAEVDGFTFQHCYCGNNGSGLRAYGGAVVTITNCLFRENYAEGTGAGVFAYLGGSHITIEDCKFIKNQASSGTAGMCIEDALLDAINCRFIQNTALEQAAALQCNYGIMQVTDCAFYNNSSDDLSGGIYYFRSSGVASNNTFHGNSSPGSPEFGPYGASMVVHQSPDVVVERNIFSEDIGGFGMLIIDSTITHSCNLYWENTLGPIYGDTLTTDEIEANPLFCSPETNYFTLYHESPANAPNSPCGQLIGAFGPACDGTVPVAVAFFDVAAVDNSVHVTWEIAGGEEVVGYKLYRTTLPHGSAKILNDGIILSSRERSFVDDAIDPGKTYEYRLGVLLPDQSEMFSAPVTVTIHNFIFALERNIPNPFNPTTTIPYSIEEAGHVILRIYDVRGNLITTLVDENKPAGRHTAVWTAKSQDGIPVASGIYFAQLQSQGNVSTQKMMLLK